MLAMAASALSVGSPGLKTSASGNYAKKSKRTWLLNAGFHSSPANKAEFCRFTCKLAAIRSASAARARIGPPGESAVEQAVRNHLRSTEHVLIDDVLADRFAVERAQDIARGLLAHPVDRFPRHACDMRRHDDVGKLKQRMAGRRRLLLENIEPGAGKLAGHQRVIQRRLVDNPTACGIDEIGRRLHALQARRIEHPDRLWRLRAVDADT